MTTPLLRSDQAPPPRTLVDIFRATAADAPDAPALDNGAHVLTYAQFEEAADLLADELTAVGVGPGDAVGVRISSGTTELYVAIMGVLMAGAAYVPVDADDPDERARVVFDEADVAAVLGDDLTLSVRRERAPRERRDPSPDDDAWVIFTSGSTGKPKGVAVTHRNAAAFVDAESRLFLQDAPLGIDDRVMAGLSVAFDASCEEMWLAWRYGGTLVPAPRALVRSGVEVAPWLAANRITVVSTVPTLVSLWPDESLRQARLVILGGEACPPELAARLAVPGREVWNTYGPTEATVVACAARLTAQGPVRIGLPLDGWDLAVVDDVGQPVEDGATGELIIGGVGLARYLDAAKDAEKYARMPSLGWQRAYRSGDRVVNDPEGLLFAGRGDDQIKLGGRRIELGEIDNALLSLPGVQGAAAAVRRSAAGNQLLVGYITVDDDFDPAAATASLRRDQPAALVPRLAVVDDLPTRTSGKVDRDALPWPVPSSTAAQEGELHGTAALVAQQWLEVLGAQVTSADEDFFDLGGGSLSAAQLVGRLRVQFPDLTVGDLYEHPQLGALAGYLDTLTDGGDFSSDRTVKPIPRKTQIGQILGATAARMAAVPRWSAWILLCDGLISWWFGVRVLPTVPWWVLVPMVALFLTPPGRMLLSAGVARFVLRGITPGEYPRGGKVHLRLWLAERLTEQLGALSLSGAVFVRWYARLLGARIGPHVDLHSVPPVTGLLDLGKGAAIEPEVDLTGYWVDGDVLHLGRISVGRGARVGTRSMLCPGAQVGDGAEIAAGSAVFGHVPNGEFWSGSPATHRGRADVGNLGSLPAARRRWTFTYASIGLVLGLLPAVAIGAAGAAALALADTGDITGIGDLVRVLLPWSVPAVLLAWVLLAAMVLAIVRLCGAGLVPGTYPVASSPAVRAWTTMRVLDQAREWLFPLYSSQLTPSWLRALGARIGKDVEASTVLMIPALTTVNAESFLADDTLIGGYELDSGWMRLQRVKIGKRSFVGNSGMAAPGRKVPKRGLVAVLSAAPRGKKAKAGESWIGSPPTVLRRAAQDADSARTYAPARRLKIARAIFELARIVPVLVSIGLGAALITAAAGVERRWGPLAFVVALLVLLPLAGALAAVITSAAKWLLVGRVRVSEHPLWSSFVWRNELADTFVELLAAPWFARAVTGTPLLSLWFRSMGARVGRGVWCETYWLPEPDLIRLDDGATVNQGTVVQTHLFHDRVLATDEVRLHRGATLGPNSVILPAAALGRHATVGPVSLVMRGESVPDKTRWIGNPIGPWVRDEA